jgi:hypothetical protein
VSTAEFRADTANNVGMRAHTYIVFMETGETLPEKAFQKAGIDGVRKVLF